MDQELLTRVTDGLAVVTFNRPERLNALSRGMLRDFGGLLAQYAEDPEIGCVVVTGAGKAFCSGGDVQVQARTAAQGSTLSPEQRADQLRSSMTASELLHHMPKPTIAMVNGVAAGAGMSIALACDMRIVAESARMTTAFAKVGLSGDYGGSYFLTRIVGPALARELYFTSEILGSARLAALGLASRVVPDAALEAETMALANRLAGGPRVAWRYIKRNMKAAEEGSLSDVLDSEAYGMLRCRQTEDHAEAARAFVEKRAPVFRGH
jgi:2-(1,2-epoxy-1,2-dihydrophenyl)acetyl-CoA isomerase